MHFSQSKSTKCEIFVWNFDFSGTTYHRDLKQVPLDLACIWNPKYAPLKPLWCIFPSQNQQNVKFLAEILIFQELLIVETWNQCHWIWHISNPKYVPLKPFWCIFPSQNQQNVKFLPEILIFQEPLIIDTWNKCHWIWHTSNPKYVPLKPFWCIFPSQNQQNVKFLSEILIFQELLIIETWTCAIGFGTPQTLNTCATQAILMHFSQSKSTKCEIFAWNFDFSGTTYHRYLKPVPLDLAHLKP